MERTYKTVFYQRANRYTIRAKAEKHLQCPALGNEIDLGNSFM